MKKYISAIAVTALVIIVPFGSWYYLQTGLQYRKDLGEEVAAKGKIEEYVTSWPYRGETVALSRNLNAGSSKDSILQFYRQYQEAPTFLFVEQGGQEGSTMGDRHIPLQSDITVQWPNGVDFMAVDTSGVVRSFYGRQSNSIKKMAEHMAIILPRPKDKDIRMRNGQDIDAKPSFMKREE